MYTSEKSHFWLSHHTHAHSHSLSPFCSLTQSLLPSASLLTSGAKGAEMLACCRHEPYSLLLRWCHFRPIWWVSWIIASDFEKPFKIKNNLPCYACVTTIPSQNLCSEILFCFGAFRWHEASTIVILLMITDDLLLSLSILGLLVLLDPNHQSYCFVIPVFLLLFIFIKETTLSIYVLPTFV